jgi:hypothetical protein
MTQAHRLPAHQLALVARALPRAVPIVISAPAKSRPHIGDATHRALAAIRAWLLARPQRVYHAPHHLDFIEDAAMGREMLRL